MPWVPLSVPLLDLGPTLKQRVTADLTALVGVDNNLRTADDTMRSNFAGSGDNGLQAIIDAISWQLGDLDGIMNVNDLNYSEARTNDFGNMIADSQSDLKL